MQGIKETTKRNAIFLADPKLSVNAIDVILTALSNWNLRVFRDWSQVRESAIDAQVGLFFLADSGTDNSEPRHALNRTLAQLKQVEWVAITTENQLGNAEYTSLLARYASDYFTYPFDGLEHRLEETLGHTHGMARLRAEYRAPSSNKQHFDIVGESPAMKKIYDLIPRLARSTAPVLISGDTGTGKELIAKTIHEQSGRAKGPFIPVNCGAIPDNLVESELFGHRKGAFTGADHDKIGLIQAADGGTLLLDEIGDLPALQQVKLLRFLQEGTITPVGATRPAKVDARVIAATHVDLEQSSLDGKFRSDLFYRLNVLQLHAPSLSERIEDIEVLADYFLDIYNDEATTKISGFAEQTLRAMRNHNWRGNVRELMNRIRKGVVLCQSRYIEPEDIGLSSGIKAETSSGNGKVVHLADSVSAAQKQAIKNALQTSDYNISKAARELGVSRMTLYRLLEKHDIQHAS
ncbi:MAG TPA: sigma-54-dependent Fis family transcriptional regulator [Porticoccaceae bacterium]|nr:sigma-54-dependent Fis family transcriptional regulator [Porticoccaceae bacterium]